MDAKVARERLVQCGAAYLKMADKHDDAVSKSLARVELFASMAELPDSQVVRIWPWFTGLFIPKV